MSSLRSGCTLAACLAVLGSAVLAQRPSPGQRPPRGRPVQAPKKEEPKPEKKEEKKNLPQVAYVGGVVHIGDGRVLRSGTVLTKGGKIEKVGVGIEIPEKAKKVDCSGKHVSPGFIALNASGLGMGGISSGNKAVDSIDPFEDNIARALAVGITSYLYVSGGGSTVPTGNSAVVKLQPGDLEDVVVSENVLVTLRAPLSPANFRKLEESVKKAKEYLKERKEYERKSEAGDKNAKAPKLDKKLKPLLDVMRGDTRLRITCGGSAKDLRGAIEVCNLLEVPATIWGTAEAWVVADELAEAGCGCVVYPRESRGVDKTREDPNGTTIQNAKILTDAGITVAVAVAGSRWGGSGIGNGGLLGTDLNTPFIDAAFAVRGGLSDEEGLSTLCAGPAKLLGLEDRIGTLEPGKDADLLILNGDPLHYATFVDQAVVNGKLRYDRSKYPFYRKLGSR